MEQGSTSTKRGLNPRCFRSVILFLLLLSAIAGLGGCATTSDSDQVNYSERPWNTPRDWETGLPSSLNQGR